MQNTEVETEQGSNLDKSDTVQIKGSEFGIIRMFFLCSTGFIFGRLFIFPGFLDPFAPSHLDLFRYFLISQDQWAYRGWLTPRPLMIAFLHIAGIFRDPSLIWFILSLTSLVFATALLLLLQRLGKYRANNISVLLYSTIIFSLPTSFEIYQLDYGGMLAGVLSVVAILIWFYFYKTNPLKAFSLSLLIYWISLETKPTFAASILFLALLQLLFYRDRKSLLLLGGVFGVSILVVLKDRFLGSPFLDFGGGTGVYSVKVNLTQNIDALWVYISRAVPQELLPGLLFAYYIFSHVFKRGWGIIVLLLLLAISSIMPMVLIPNRTLDLYAWYCGMLICIPFLYIFQADTSTYANTNPFINKISKALLPVCLVITFAAMSIGSKLHSDQAIYDNFISSYNGNVVASLEKLSDQNINYHFASSEKILVAGLRGPFHPFRNRKYILNATHLPDTYTLLLRKSETAWNNMSSEMGPAIYSSELDLDSFDYFIIYDQDGHLTDILSQEDIKAIPKWEVIPSLVCNLNSAAQNQIVNNVLENEIACLDGAGESQAVIELLDNTDISNITPLLHYYLGHAYQIMGNFIAARTEYKLALAAGENAFFQNALMSLPEQ